MTVSDFFAYMKPGKVGHLIGIGGVSMSPLAEVLQSVKWIIDGDYSRTYEPRFLRCDTVIFLDYAESVCMDGIRMRVGQTRADMPWTEQTLDPELVALVRGFSTEQRPQILALLDRCPDKQVLIFHTREAADRWLETMGESI